MNAIAKAIAEVHFRIPHEILDITFRDTNTKFFTTIDKEIQRRVVEARVLVDCNLVGGMEILYPISDATILEQSDSHTVVKLNDVQIGNRKLLQAISISNSIVGAGSYAMNPGGSSSSRFAGATGGNADVTATMEVIGDNTILIHENFLNIQNAVIKILVENSRNTSNLNVATYPAFSRLVEYATKAYIHNHLVVKLDRGYIYQGHELGIIKEIIDEYKDYHEMYLEYLEIKWKKIAFMDDAVSMDNYVTSLFGPTV